MRMASIASGSSGNCIYVGTDHTHVLIDAGISNKRIELGLGELGVKGDELDAILITHEHSDHIKGLSVFSRKHHVPVYATGATIEGIIGSAKPGSYPEDVFHAIVPDVDWEVKDLHINSFSVDHDAADPVAYRLQSERRSVAVATDMGHFDQYIINHLLNLDALLLESNHDVRMLETGPYPYYLKQRILGDHGHLSNENAGRLLSYVLNDNMKHIFLGHLSKENNYEALAYETVKLEIDQGDCPYRSCDFEITVAKRDCMSDIVYL